MLLLLAAFLVLLNGFFVAAEFALVKVRTTQLDPLVQRGHATARLARHLVKHLDPYLSATQLGITLASLGLGWVGEPALASLLEPAFHGMGIHDASQMHAWSAAIAFTIISFLHIVVGEIAPKSVAIAKPLATTLLVSWPMRGLYWLFWPFLVVLNGSSNLLLKLLGVRPVAGHTLAITAEELRHIAVASAKEGALTQGEGELLSNVLAFSDRVAREIMVPRGRVDFLNVTDTLDHALRRVVSSGHTRFPLIENSVDNVIGVLNQKDLLPFMLDGKVAPPLAKIARPVFYVPENMPAQKLMLEFQRRKSHFAVVVDEFGGLSGIVTLEDALEELVGEIQDEFDQETPSIQALAEGNYLVDGGVLLTEVAELAGLPEIPSDADTVGGYVMEYLGRMPEVNDVVMIPAAEHPWQLTVRAMDRLRVSRVELAPLNPEPPSVETT